MTQSIGSIKLYQGSDIELLVRNSDGTRKVLTGKIADIDTANNRLYTEVGVGALHYWIDLSDIEVARLLPGFMEHSTLELSGSVLKYDTENQQIKFAEGDALSFSTDVHISKIERLDRSINIILIDGGFNPSPRGLKVLSDGEGNGAIQLFDDEWNSKTDD